jgi:pyruvate carboxylase
LGIDEIIALAIEKEVDAIHPLQLSSENSEFAKNAKMPELSLLGTTAEMQRRVGGQDCCAQGCH